MKSIYSFSELSSWLLKNPNPAFVPTMGALHDGHLSLVREAKKSDKPVLVSVFVNPTQFGPNEDFEKYPRDQKGDAEKLVSAGADAVWFPENQDMYPEQSTVIRSQLTEIPIPPLPSVFSELEGEIRPTHFLGVAQVLQRFFDIIRPSSAFFGQKDYQQTVLVKWLVKSMNLPIRIVICPIVREVHGLAMSSRNEYLALEKRKAAGILYRSLQEVKRRFLVGERNPDVLAKGICSILGSKRHIDSIDYVEILSADTLEKISIIKNPVVVLLAVRIGRVRLLDNIILAKSP